MRRGHDANIRLIGRLDHATSELTKGGRAKRPRHKPIGSGLVRFAFLAEPRRTSEEAPEQPSVVAVLSVLPSVEMDRKAAKNLVITMRP